MKLKILLLGLILAAQTLAQPLASPRELGMSQQYFLRAGISGAQYLGAYDGQTQVSINPDEEVEGSSVTAANLPQLGAQAIYRLGIGSRLDQHHFGLDIGWAPIENGYFELAIDYQYQLGTQAWRPAVVFGLDYLQMDVLDAGVDGDRTPDARFAGKGFHFGGAYNFYNNYIGWENRLVVRGLSIDNIFIAGDKYRVADLLMSWAPQVESSFVVFF